MKDAVYALKPTISKMVKDELKKYNIPKQPSRVINDTHVDNSSVLGATFSGPLIVQHFNDGIQCNNGLSNYVYLDQNKYPSSIVIDFPKKDKKPVEIIENTAKPEQKIEKLEVQESIQAPIFNEPTPSYISEHIEEKTTSGITHSHSRRFSKKTLDIVFILVMLAYPVLQFLITWIFVNFDALSMAFNGSDTFDGFEFTFYNFKKIFDDLSSPIADQAYFFNLNPATIVLLNSLGYCFITIFISLPLSLLFSYFLRKKMPLANVFRAIFFLPNIIPIVALTFAFRMSYTTPFGYLSGLFESLGINSAKYPTSQILVYVYCIWAGLGYNIILFSGAIGRIPKELFESAELDHAGYFKEFLHVVVPCIWPTIVTLVVVGMTNVLTLYMHPYLLTNYDTSSTYTIALSIFQTAGNDGAMPNDLHQVTAYGLFFSAVWAPIILLVRHLMSKKYEGIGY